ncbi:MAG: hypothetical protein A3J79_13535 [Elusimicrobia bacterium RIFOXYB2_FULL_62_6]|nr:MAG: hypothetical protein A3J79_13535 [Elusimicrobia bacterium RIFOXYB2_FULL_62_6]
MKILIADDNAGIREMLKLVLQSLGHEVVGEADNGEAAIKAFRELRPEVVMLDIIMPGKTGLAALDEIRALDPAAKVVMLTAVDQDDVNLRVADKGAVMIYKPFSSLDIEKAFNRLK